MKPQDPKVREARRAKVAQMLAAQFERSEIERKLAAEFGCSERTIRTDFQVIYAQWDAESHAERPARRSQLRSTIRAILRKALATSDIGNALRATEMLARLDGLYESLKTEIKISGEIDYRNMTSDEKRREIARIISMYSSHSVNGTNGKSNGQSHDDLN